MPGELDGIVQRMIDAGEPEENIALVIKEYQPPTPAKTPFTIFGRPMRADMQAAVDSAKPEDVMAEPIGPNIFGALKAAPGIIAKGGLKDVAARAVGRSSIRAGENMQAAASAASKTPVTELAAVRAGGARAKELQATGSRMPRVVTQLMNRIESNTPISFREAQDFVTNLSRLSANEFNSINPQMHRQVVEMSKTLRQGLVAAAGKGGGAQAAEQYTAGVTEYAKAAEAAKRWEQLKPGIWKTLKGLGYAGAVGAGYKGLMPDTEP